MRRFGQHVKYFGIKPLTLVSFWLDPPNKQKKKIKRKPVIFPQENIKFKLFGRKS